MCWSLCIWLMDYVRLFIAVSSREHSVNCRKRFFETDSIILAPNKTTTTKYERAALRSRKGTYISVKHWLSGRHEISNIILDPYNTFLLRTWSTAATRSPMIRNHNTLLCWRPPDMVHLVHRPWKRSGHLIVALIAQLNQNLFQTRPIRRKWMAFSEKLGLRWSVRWWKTIMSTISTPVEKWNWFHFKYFCLFLHFVSIRARTVLKSPFFHLNFFQKYPAPRSKLQRAAEGFRLHFRPWHLIT